ncbi:MAG: hydrolase [Betaproteobacteria bacterium]
MSSCRCILVIAAMAALLQGCSTLRSAVDPTLISIDDSRLPRTDIAANIPGLGPCTDNPDRTLHLNSGHPVAVLVHGCYGSSGQFRALAQVLAFHGQQTACFTYDDRAALDVSAAALAASIDRLLKLMTTPAPAPPVTIIGHSQGALVARRAVTTGKPFVIGAGDTQLGLVTISGPFAGIAAADACGSPIVRVLSLGLIAPMCRLGTGDKWADITYSSDFIRNPGALSKQVVRHLKLDTDERGSCRRLLDGRCVEDDLTFTLAEQRNPAVDRDAATTVVEVKAGHVEIVGDHRVAPVKLIAVLQQNGIIGPTEPQRVAAFSRLLWDVYRDPTVASSTGLLPSAEAFH